MGQASRDNAGRGGLWIGAESYGLAGRVYGGVADRLGWARFGLRYRILHGLWAGKHAKGVATWAGVTLNLPGCWVNLPIEWVVELS